jgi:hypothetical protein
MNTKHDLLDRLAACKSARAFAKDYPDLETAWLACERGDWLLWFAAKRGVKRETLVLAACECARLALPHTKDPRVLACIETAEKWCRGEATMYELVAARRAAAAAYAAAAADAADAASAAAAYAAADADAAADAASAAYAYAAAAADAAADAAAAAAAAAYAAAAYAAAAAAYAAADAARKSTFKQCAEIARKHFPTLP